MRDGPSYDRERFPQETGASTGDARENDPKSAGFTPAEDQLFRSHFQRVNRLADRAYEMVRPAYQLGFGAAAETGAERLTFDDVERDLENSWLNVRTGRGDWASVREFARAGYEHGRGQGRVQNMPHAGTTRSHDRASFSDPLADGMDPTSPGSPEQSLE